MRATHAINGSPPADIGLDLRRPRRQVAQLEAHLRAPWLDRQLAGGVVPWRSTVHAARAVQLTSDRRRRALARSLERLVELGAEPLSPRRGAAIPPCREQVRDALPLIMMISARLRSAEPVDARGAARLRALLCDGGGPCYIPSRADALTDALQAVSQWLHVAD